MDNKKFEKFLESIKIPDVEPGKHKEQLKRELLNSTLFEEKRLFQKILKKEFILSLALSILFITFLIFQFTNKTKSVDDIIKSLNNNYAGLISSKQLNKFNSNLELFGKESGSLNLYVENTFDIETKRYIITLKDKSTGEILDKVLFIGNEIYGIPDPKIQVLNTVGSFYLPHIGFYSNFQPDSIDASNDTTKVFIKNLKEFVPQCFDNSGKIVYYTGNKISNEVRIAPNNFNTLPVDYHLDFSEYIKSNPIDIFNEISSADTLHYEGEAYDQKLEMNLDVLVLKNELSKENAKKILLFIQGQKDLSERNNADSNLTKADSVHQYFVQIEDSLLKNIETTPEAFEEVKRIRINPLNGKIIGINFELKSKLSTIKLSEISFINHITTVINDQLFDPVSQGFILRGHKINISKTLMDLDINKYSAY